MDPNPQRWNDLASPGPYAAGEVIRDLGDGLVLRYATEADCEALAHFNRVVHADPPRYEPTRPIEHWTRDLLGGGHPRVRARDFALVEDTKGGRVASTLCLISHRLRYDGIEFDAGQPELVGTHPDFRRRGLVALQFELIHDWSAARGHKLQLIDGIPWYYRQYGYEMALENHAARVAHLAHLPEEAPEGGPRIRGARPEDAGLLRETFEIGGRRQLLSCARDEDFCRYELAGRSSGSAARRVIRVIESPSGQPLALLAHLPFLWLGYLNVTLFERSADVPWHSMIPGVLHALRASGEGYAARHGAPFRGVVFDLGTQHPLYEVAGARMPEVRRPYAYYVRVPDLGDFLKHVAPALERRLASSPFAGHSGGIDVSFYRTGFRMLFEAGRLTAVEPWRPSTEERGHVAFPDLTFLQLLLGHRSLDELLDSFPDCIVWSETRASILRALFPKRGSALSLTV